jgi:4-azaleucine resistance transporter AzlC
MIFGLTDETYALMTSINIPKGFDKKKYFFFITLFAQIYWVLGCTIGALSSEILSFNTEGMEFAATALFVVLLIEQWIMVKRLLPFMIGFIASFIALMFFIDHMLIVAIIISIGSILIFRLIKKSHDE